MIKYLAIYTITSELHIIQKKRTIYNHLINSKILIIFYTKKVSFILQTTNGQILNKICKLPAKTGPCRAHMPRYFYNPTSSSCEKFIYGGKD